MTKEVISIFKQVAVKFNELQTNFKLSKKITDFQILILIMRGRGIENKIDQFYDREKLVFINNDSLFEATPQTIFLTNYNILEPLFDFILKTRFIKLYNDFT